MKTWPARLSGLLQGLAVLLGLAFVFAGGMKLNQPSLALPMFESLELGAWMIEPAGWIEVVAGLLLINAATRGIGTALLGCWMLAFLVIGMISGQVGTLLASLLVGGFCLAYLGSGTATWPSSLAQGLPAPLNAPPARVPSAVGAILRMLGLAFMIRWAVGGVLYWSFLPLLAWSDFQRSQDRDENLGEFILLYLLVLGLGVSGIWGFVGHYFMGDQVAGSVGWAAGSPFQKELAFYHLGLGTAGLLCLYVRDHFWTAVSLIASVFLGGAGLVHLLDYLGTGNDAPANWGFNVLFGSLLLPLALAALIRQRLRRHPRPPHSAR